MDQFGKFGEATYLALIGDVVASRDSEDRAELQESLRRALAETSTQLGDSLAADLQLTAGDEVQGLFEAPAAAIDAMQLISDRIQPARILFGLGVGDLTTGPLPPRADIRLPLLDGHCFHRARSALERATRSQVWASIDGADPYDEPLNSLLELIGTLRWRWKERQSIYTASARSAPQKVVAEQHGVGPSVVSESLKGAYFETVLRGEGGARSLLNTLAENSAKTPN